MQALMNSWDGSTNEPALKLCGVRGSTLGSPFANRDLTRPALTPGLAPTALASTPAPAPAPGASSRGDGFWDDFKSHLVAPPGAVAIASPPPTRGNDDCSDWSCELSKATAAAAAQPRGVVPVRSRGAAGPTGSNTPPLSRNI